MGRGIGKILSCYLESLQSLWVIEYTLTVMSEQTCRGRGVKGETCALIVSKAMCKPCAFHHSISSSTIVRKKYHDIIEKGFMI